QRREFEAELERSLTPVESAARAESSREGVRSDAAQSAATIIETASLLSKERHPNNLSEELTSLIGREDETAAIEKMLGRDDVRLVTLTGVGGTGKTRLAEHVAREMIQEFEDGVFFIDLAPVSDPMLFASSIAQPLGVQEVGGKPLADTLKDFLRERRMLLVLDNFEQVTAAATLVKELLSVTHGLKMLVTSRVPLHLLAEHEFNVPPLEFPAAQELPATEELLGYAAVALFVERAQAVKPTFALADNNAKAVAEICSRLDGLPLAIKLAAARVKVLQPQAILARLENRLKLLTGGARDLPARQQTMRSAISWSYDLLEEYERKLLNRLSVFAGGSTLKAAEKVCGASGDLQLEMLDAIASLVDKSLLVQKEQADGESRYRMLEVVREYAQEQLEGSGEGDEVQRRHAEFFRSLAERAEPELTGPRQAEWYERLEEEHDNLRAALQWSVTNNVEGALRLAGAIGFFWNTRGHYTEGRRWYEEALRRSGDCSASVRAKALTGVGSLACQQGDYQSAGKFYEEALQLSKETGDTRRGAVASRGLGVISYEQGDLKRARTFFEESLAIRRDLGDKRLISAGISTLGELERIEGNFEAARSLYEEALALGRQTNDKQNVCSNLLNLGAVSYQEGDFEAARSSFVEALRIAHELGKKSYITLSLDGFAALAFERGEMNRAACLAGAAEALREEIGYELETPDRLFRESYLGELRVALAPADFTPAYGHGCAMKMKQAVAFALESLAAPDTLPK
ncbi:MAG TPA: tetratricopeptide repeat protein, partial [Pyrinomonadaceae bacterium]